MSALLDSAFNLVHDYPGGAASLAPRIGKNATSLNHELKATGSAKFGLVDACKATQLTGNLAILNAFAAECGCIVLPLPERDATCDTFRQLADAAREFGEFVTSVADAAADSQVTANELARVDRELGEMIAGAQAVRAHLAGIHEAGKPNTSKVGM
jgi:hypothetical protein